jgi:hypothetical protein
MQTLLTDKINLFRESVYRTRGRGIIICVALLGVLL